MAKKETTTKLDDQADEMQKKAFERMSQLLNAKRGDIDGEELRNELLTLNLATKMVNNYQMMKRISQSHQIRVFSFITTNEEERKKYIELAMPQMIVHQE